MKKTNRYSFSKDGHYHSLDNIPLHGTTTALGIIAKPALIPWASNMAVEAIRKEWKINKPYTKEEREKILEKGKNAHRAKKQAGADVGTSVHEAIELWITADCPAKKHVPHKTFCGEDEQVLAMFGEFVKWKRQNKVKFLFTEKKVYSEKHWYGGIVDFVCTIEGKRYVGDIKTSNGIFPEHFLQMGAYDIALQEMGEPGADGYIIVNLQKSGKIRTKHFNNTKKFQDAFLHALELYKTMKTMKWNNYY